MSAEAIVNNRSINQSDTYQESLPFPPKFRKGGDLVGSDPGITHQLVRRAPDVCLRHAVNAMQVIGYGEVCVAEVHPDENELDDDLEGVRKAVEASLASAEDHLELPRGTLAEIETDTDFMFVMKMWSTLEPLLNEAFSKEISGGLVKYKVEHEGAAALAEFVASANNMPRKIDLAHNMGIIKGRRHRYCKALFEVRNHYGHNVRNLHLSIWSLLKEKFPKAQRESLYKALAQNDIIPVMPDDFFEISIRIGSFYQFASFLSDVLDVVKPRPWAGLLGQLQSAAGVATEEGD